MKINILFLASLFAFFSCKSKTSTVVNNNDSSVTTTKNYNEIAKRFMPVIQGIWVKNSYISSLAETKSPYKSFYKLEGVASLIISKKDLKADSIMVGVNWNNHEGGQFTVLFEPGHKQNSLKTRLADYKVASNFYEIGYNINRKDTSLILYHYNKKNLLINTIEYTKVLNSSNNDDLGSGIDYKTNDMLISGKYSMIDSTGNKQAPAFTNDGKLFGFNDFKIYNINTDFEAGPGNNIDEICFDFMAKNEKHYAFKLISDTLKLYEIRDNADSTIESFGKLQYTLIKNK